MKIQIISILVAVLCCASNIDAETVIYSDSFEGASGEALNGRIPDVCSLANATWLSGSSGKTWMADGTIALLRQSSNAFLPFTPQHGKVYSLSLDVCPDGPLGAGFLSLGFAGTNKLDEAFVSKSAMASPWMFINNDWVINPLSRLASEANENKKITRTYRTYLGAGNNGTLHCKEAYGEWVSAEIILDTRKEAWAVKWHVNGECVRTQAYQKNPVIRYIGIGRFRQAGGAVDNFRLSVIVE